MSEQTQDENKRNVERLFETFNNGDLAALDELVGPEYVGAQGEQGRPASRRSSSACARPSPTSTTRVDDVVAEGDKVAVRWHWTGTHRGAVPRLPADGQGGLQHGRRDLPARGRQDRRRRAGDRSPGVPRADRRRSRRRGARSAAAGHQLAVRDVALARRRVVRSCGRAPPPAPPGYRRAAAAQAARGAASCSAGPGRSLRSSRSTGLERPGSPAPPGPARPRSRRERAAPDQRLPAASGTKLRVPSTVTPTPDAIRICRRHQRRSSSSASALRPAIR